VLRRFQRKGLKISQGTNPGGGFIYFFVPQAPAATQAKPRNGVLSHTGHLAVALCSRLNPSEDQERQVKLSMKHA